MANNKNGNTSRLSKPQQLGSTLPDLSNAPGSRLKFRIVHSLYRVYYKQRRLNLLRLCKNNRQIGRRHDKQATAGAAKQ